jgi:hypothetical protein
LRSYIVVLWVTNYNSLWLRAAIFRYLDAVSVYVLVAIVRKRLGLEASLYQILQILSLTLFEKTHILCAPQAIDADASCTDNVNQLILSNF